MAFSPDGSRIVDGLGGGCFRVVDISTGEIVDPIKGYKMLQRPTQNRPKSGSLRATHMASQLESPPVQLFYICGALPIDRPIWRKHIGEFLSRQRKPVSRELRALGFTHESSYLLVCGRKYRRKHCAQETRSQRPYSPLSIGGVSPFDERGA
ncbi:hypothetical protein BV22DRAFT_653767 [Leucogyrophana mollusca]|uniref:Uncharacterized protein n=1 Tax=Leucogyrophana mollusca TaxID=85980 RepID=A0ACB8BCF2_9AGAM|nr:hypothetical protein BV22DRAFT_653767 [Leucogyrophana mollusca]